MSVASTLLAVPLFTELRQDDLERISRAAWERSYPKNSVIVFEDDPEDALYVVLSGQVKVVLIGEDGREVILSVRSKGDFFGEMSLISDAPRAAHVIAMEDAKLLVLRREHFQRCVEEMPRIAFGLLRSMCNRLRQADDKIGGLVLLDVPGRVARLLVEMADENDGVHTSKRLTHQTIAQMIGSSRETVSRAIRDLTGQDLILVERDTITIKNRKSVERMAGLVPRRLRRSGAERRLGERDITFPERREGIDRRTGSDRRISMSA